MKFKVHILSIFLIGLFSIQPTISLGDDSLETVQLTLVITSADEINVTAVVTRAIHFISTSFLIRSIRRAPAKGKKVVTVNTGKSRLFIIIPSIFYY